MHYGGCAPAQYTWLEVTHPHAVGSGQHGLRRRLQVTAHSPRACTGLVLLEDVPDPMSCLSTSAVQSPLHVIGPDAWRALVHNRD